MTGSPNATESFAARLRNVQVGVRPELEVCRQIFRGIPMYVVQDPVTFTSHELSVDDYQILVSIDGERTLGDVFADLVEKETLEADREEEFYQFIVKLNQLGLLSLPVSDGKSLYSRFEKKLAARRRSQILGVLFLRVPLFQPDAFLGRTMRFAAPLFSRIAFGIWLLALLLCLYIVGIRWQEFRNPLSTMLTLQNIPMLWMLLIGLKTVHEFGHAYACKHFGGHVPEMGAFFILFTPCAYVDASASWGFTNRFHRIFVSLAGMYFESMVAMVAMIVWCLTGPSAVHSAAQYTVVLSTIVTVGFNVNPLMKYDGYYVFSDLLNRPNLRQNAQAQLISSFKRILYGIELPPSSDSRASRLFLITYALASACYKVVVVLGISAMIALKLPLAGLLIATVFLCGSIWQLGSKLVNYVVRSEEVADLRMRAILVTVGIATAVVVGVMTIPTPGSVRAAGVVGRRDDRIVRSPATGFLSESRAQIGDAVREGELLCVLENMQTVSQLKRKRAEIEQLRVQLHRQAMTEPQAAASTSQKLEQARNEASELQHQLAWLDVTAPISGQITNLDGIRELGRYVRKGEPLATLSSGPWVLKAITDEQTWSTARPAVGDKVQIYVDAGLSEPLTGHVLSVGSSGTRHIGEMALTHLGGGSIPVSADGEADRAFFEIRIAIIEPDGPCIGHGMTAWANFAAQSTPLGARLYRRLLNFLNQLEVASL